MNEKEKKRLRETADEFLRTVKERVDLYVLTGDVEGLGRLVTQVKMVSGYEVLKAIRDKGLDDEITKLADKAGKIK